MNEISITSKDIHIQRKRGRGISFLLERYNISDEKILFDLIHRLSPGDAEQLIREFKRNEKKRSANSYQEKNRNDASKSSKKEEFEIVINPIFCSQIDEATFGFDGVQSESDSASEGNITGSSKLQKLLDEENELSNSLYGLEAEYKKLYQKRKRNFALVKDAKKKCELLLQEVENLNVQIDKYRKRHDDMSRKITKYAEDIKATREILKSVREKISQLQAISIFIYEDGRIEVEGADVPDILEKDINSLYEVLINKPDAEIFTIREIKALARLILMVGQYQKDIVSLELYFDNAKLQIYYDTLAKEFLH